MTRTQWYIHMIQIYECIYDYISSVSLIALLAAL